MLRNLFLVSFVLANQVIFSSDLLKLVTELVDSSPRTRAAMADVKSQKHGKDERESRFRSPNFNIDTNYGTQTTESFGQPAVREDAARGFNARMTQLLMDFGQSANALKESESVIEQSKQQHLVARQGLILEVLTAYLSVQRAQEVLDSAIKAENNIKNQASLEDALVDAGKGYRSDVLHAKAQLASAQARRVRAEGSLDVAKARMEAVCGELYPKVRYFQKVNYSSKDLPKSLVEAKKTALENNLQLRVGSARSQALGHRLDAARIEDKAPKVELVAQIERNWDADGVLRRKRDDRFMVQVSWDQNFGSAEPNRLGAIQQDLEASRQREQETIQLVGEQVLIAWRNYATANSNEEIIKNQVELARQFLDAARQERKSGRRSLLDVLSAETRVLDAEADLFATSYDKKIAAFTLMQAVGILDLKHIAVLTK